MREYSVESTMEKLKYLKATKADIADAIEEKGVEVPYDTTFREYEDKINSIVIPEAIPITIRHNGKYIAPSNSGYSPVVVDIPNGPKKGSISATAATVMEEGDTVYFEDQLSEWTKVGGYVVPKNVYENGITERRTKDATYVCRTGDPIITEDSKYLCYLQKVIKYVNNKYKIDIRLVRSKLLLDEEYYVKHTFTKNTSKNDDDTEIIENPSEDELYERFEDDNPDNDIYKLSSDDEVDEEKEYYKQIFEMVENPIGVPSDNQYYELDDDGFSLTNDKEVDLEKVYFRRAFYELQNPDGNPFDSEYYELEDDVYVLSNDIELDDTKTYYEKTYSELDDPNGNPFINDYYELIDDEFIHSVDRKVNSDKVYYEILYLKVDYPEGKPTAKHYYELEDIRYNLSLDKTVDPKKTYYKPLFEKIDDPSGKPSENQYYEIKYSGYVYKLTNDIQIDEEKDYYEKKYKEAPIPWETEVLYEMKDTTYHYYPNVSNDGDIGLIILRNDSITELNDTSYVASKKVEADHKVIVFNMVTGKVLYDFFLKMPVNYDTDRTYYPNSTSSYEWKAFPYHVNIHCFDHYICFDYIKPIPLSKYIFWDKEQNIAVKNHNSGDKFIFNGAIYTSLNDINAGDELIVDENIKLDTSYNINDLENWLCACRLNLKTKKLEYSIIPNYLHTSFRYTPEKLTEDGPPNPTIANDIYISRNALVWDSVSTYYTSYMFRRSIEGRYQSEKIFDYWNYVWYYPHEFSEEYSGRIYNTDTYGENICQFRFYNNAVSGRIKILTQDGFSVIYVHRGWTNGNGGAVLEPSIINDQHIPFVYYKGIHWVGYVGATVSDASDDPFASGLGGGVSNTGTPVIDYLSASFEIGKYHTLLYYYPDTETIMMNFNRYMNVDDSNFLYYDDIGSVHIDGYSWIYNSNINSEGLKLDEESLSDIVDDQTGVPYYFLDHNYVKRFDLLDGFDVPVVNNSFSHIPYLKIRTNGKHTLLFVRRKFNYRSIDSFAVYFDMKTGIYSIVNFDLLPIDNSSVYTKVASPNGNPQTNKYYEKVGDEFVRSYDETVDPNKEYYQSTFYYVDDGVYNEVSSPSGNPIENEYYEKTYRYVKSTDTSIDSSKTYYHKDYVLVENPTGSPIEEGYFTRNEKYTLSKDVTVDSQKEYYESIYTIIDKPASNPSDNDYYEEVYEFVLSKDTETDAEKLYCDKDGNEILDPSGNPSKKKYYEIEIKYVKTKDEEIDDSKVYAKQSYVLVDDPEGNPSYRKYYEKEYNYSESKTKKVDSSKTYYKLAYKSVSDTEEGINPSTKEYFEKKEDRYKLTADSEVNDSKTYFERVNDENIFDPRRVTGPDANGWFVKKDDGGYEMVTDPVYYPDKTYYELVSDPKSISQAYASVTDRYIVINDQIYRHTGGGKIAKLAYNVTQGNKALGYCTKDMEPGDKNSFGLVVDEVN